MTKHADIHAALYALRYQYPTGVTTFSPCIRCKQPSRGGRTCKPCLAIELTVNWKVPAELVSRLMAAHEKARDAICELEDVREMIVQSCNKRSAISG